MEKKRNRYKAMEQSVSLVLLADLLLFIFYLIAAANGVIWLKVILCIFALIVSILCLLFLHYSGELLKQRSYWMTTGFAIIAVCVIFSLILNFPSPKPQLIEESAPQATITESL